MAPGLLENIRSVLRRSMVREFLAEFLSTYVMMVSGWVVLGGWGQQTSPLAPPHCGPQGHIIPCPTSELGVLEKGRGK